MPDEEPLQGQFIGETVIISHYACRERSSGHVLEITMTEFFRSAALVLMGLTVIGAGVFVAFYG